MLSIMIIYSLSFVLLFQSICLVTNTVGQNNSNDAVSSMRIAGYLPDYRFTAINLNQTVMFLDDLYLFSIQPQPPTDNNDKNDGDNSNDNIDRDRLSGCCLSQDYHFEMVRQAKEYKKIIHSTTTKNNNDNDSGLNVWITIGGGGERSQYFLQQPKRLLQSLQALINDINNNNRDDNSLTMIYGIDFDCESIRTRQEFQVYTKFIYHAAKMLHGNNIQVSVALHAGQFLPKLLYESIDRINLMAYDMMKSGQVNNGYNNGNNDKSNYHADISSATIAIEQLIQSGCDGNKIFLGIPAYARHLQSPGNVKTFAELYDENRINDWDFSMDQKIFNGFGFETPKQINHKVELVKNYGLGGVFFWELGQDKQTIKHPGGILLESAVRARQDLYSIQQQEQQTREQQQQQQQKDEL